MENNITPSTTDDNNQVVKVNPNGSLMHKTKVQLVDIILRKDEVERQCKSIIDTQKEIIKEKDKSIDIHKQTINRLNKISDESLQELDKVSKQLNILKNDYEEICDDVISVKVELDENKHHNFIIKLILVILLIFSLIGNWFLI